MKTIGLHRRPPSLWPWLTLAGTSTGFWFTSIQFVHYQNYLDAKCLNKVRCQAQMPLTLLEAGLTTVVLCMAVAMFIMLGRTISMWRRHEIGTVTMAHRSARWLIGGIMAGALWCVLARRPWLPQS